MEEKNDTIQKLIEEYKQHAEREGFLLNPDEKRVQNIVKALLKKEERFGERYCPCRVMTGDKEEDKKIICPCIYHKDEVKNDGHCICWLFVKE